MMKTKISILFFIMLSATTVIYSQVIQRRTVAEKVKTTMDKITAPLKLDPSQASRTDSVFTGFYQALYQLNEGAKSHDTSPGRSAFEEILNDRDKKLQIIFTADQYSQFKNKIEDLLRPYWQSHEGN